MKGRINNTLETRRLELRPWTQEDVAGFHRLWGDPAVVWWRSPTGCIDDAAQELVGILTRCDAMPAGHGWWCVRERETDEIVGNVMLQPVVGDAEGVELGYHIVADRWGEGFATEAARALLNYGSLVLGLRRIVALVHVDNAASAVVAERLGFEDDGPITHAELPHRLFVWTVDGRAGVDHWEPPESDWP